MELWKDGRSGPAGRVAGNLVLADLARSGEVFARRKGTTFLGKASIYVGRVCSKDDYLQKGQRHWANLSPAQHQDVALEAKQQKRELSYLFITATRQPAAVHYWKVPGKLVGELVSSLPVKPSDDSCWIRIRDENAKHFLEGAKPGVNALDVTPFHQEISLKADQTVALQQAFRVIPPASEAQEFTVEQLRRLNALVREFGGVASLHRALDVLNEIKG